MEDKEGQSSHLPQDLKSISQLTAKAAYQTAIAKKIRQHHCVLLRLAAFSMQLYNEEVNDLLAQDNTKLQIHESKESGIYVAGLREEIVTSVEHVLQLLEEGDRLRHVGETKMNKNSSRSHSIFRMVRI